MLKVRYFARQKVDYIAYATKEEVLRALIEIFLFCIFLLVTTILALSSQTIYAFYTNDTFRRLLVERGMEKKFIWEIKHVTSLESWWDYVKNDYLGNFTPMLRFPNGISNKKTDPFGLDKKPRFLGVNILLQPPKMRQIRVKPKKCRKHHFLNESRLCYGKYNPSDQSNEPFHKGTKYIDTKNSDIRSTWATIEIYSGGGYIEKIPLQQTDFGLDKLRNETWIDGGTRLVVLSMETYNYNTGTFSIIKLITEVLPTGNVVCAFYTTVILMESIWSANNANMVVIACVFYIIATFNMGHEVYEIITFGIRKYLKVMWNYIDWGVIFTAYISLGSSIAHAFLVTNYLRDIKNESVLASLDTVEFNDIIYRSAISLCTFQLWIRIFRFVTFNNTMLDFSMALRRCAPEIMGFASILMVSLTIFAFVGLLAFGASHPDFTTFTDGFFFMFRLMLHDFDYIFFDNVDRFWGPIYLTCYVLIILCILVNMFLAIISQTYIDVKQATEEHQVAIKDVFVNFVNKIKDCFKHITKKMTRKSKIHLPSQKSFSRKIQFAEPTSLPESYVDTNETVSTRLSENEGPQDLFGVEDSKSVTSLVESEHMLDFEADDAVGETKRQTTVELLARLHERLELLEKRFTQLNDDIDTLFSKFEGKARRTLVRRSD